MSADGEIAIYVDGDACPVKNEIYRIAERHRLPVHVVSNSWLRVPDNPLFQLHSVPIDPDAADDWIAERAGPGALVVTADIPLAARCVSAGATVISPTGKPFAEGNIGMALAMRDLNAHLRETGMLTPGGAGFTRADRSRFLNALENALQKLKRGR
ncbi:YaiI/YqxD family protein [Oceanibacterium hippocampi]|uniref:UPF0178 protein OCH7691_01064 n=1 Tax=Oceanibacterium hippocampi TaxID=745714 RepID=A0A1Y5S2A8_9PROT|nr:YaiI/YqxD family protein [Oceanibacterium hippocampi]SLN30482.1 hypothetical protein OCH7691_01064 [Oceanibacterium hippocampi]